MNVRLSTTVDLSAFFLGGGGRMYFAYLFNENVIYHFEVLSHVSAIAVTFMLVLVINQNY